MINITSLIAVVVAMKSTTSIYYWMDGERILLLILTHRGIRVGANAELLQRFLYINIYMNCVKY